MGDNIYSPEYVMDLFDRMSSTYETMNYLTSFGFSIRWRWQFLNTLNPSNDTYQVIDLLTGMGETWKALKHKYPNANISALDFSSEMLKYAKMKNDNRYSGDITLLKQDILDNSLVSDHYDVVICAFGLKTFDPQQLQTLAFETKRILKKGGQFSFVEVSKPKSYLLNTLYGFYLGKIIPILGKLLVGNPSEYKMLWKYTEKFKDSRKSAEIFQGVGLTVKHHTYFFGCATGFSGHK